MSLTQEAKLAWAGIVMSVVMNLCGLAWIAAKLDQRLATAERDITELKAKSAVDGQQDVQIATIATQLSNIQQGIGEVKAKLEHVDSNTRRD